jgi:FixJ family two-component response regulator
LPRNPVVAVVDDDESVRLSIRSLIRSLGYTAHAFASGEDFLRSAEAETIDCLVTDVQMPGMSGLELQQALVSGGNPPPIIFITAFPQDRIKQQVVAAGATCLLSKPYDGGVLVKCIEAALASRNQRED